MEDWKNKFEEDDEKEESEVTNESVEGVMNTSPRESHMKLDGNDLTAGVLIGVLKEEDESGEVDYRLQVRTFGEDPEEVLAGICSALECHPLLYYAFTQVAAKRGHDLMKTLFGGLSSFRPDLEDDDDDSPGSDQIH